MSVLDQLAPAAVFRFFEEICGIPHGSRDTKKISDYLVHFAQERDLLYGRDAMGNVLIRKPGSTGYEASEPVILQGHMDMVCQKRPEVDFDFENDGLRLSVEDGMIHANGTTLGGDDGVAVAMVLAVLDSSDIAHPPIEALFTVDEEIGLLGAAAFDCAALQGKRLINLDSEEEGILTIACAGGGCGISRLELRSVPAEGIPVVLTIDGLLGGHSGAEIHKYRANSNTLMGRFLYEAGARADFALVSVEGGEKDNAIPRLTRARVLTDEEGVKALVLFAEEFQRQLRAEYIGSDEGVRVGLTKEARCEEEVIHPTDAEKVLFFLAQVPYGVAKMSGVIEGLVETSSNPGVLKVDTASLYCETSVRSSVGSAKEALVGRIRYLTEFLGGEFELEGAYPAWEYRSDSPLRDTMARVYEEMYKKAPVVTAIHAGLECGLFYQGIPGLDCVSIGPDIHDIHTSEEKLDIASTERVWEYLLAVLRALK